MHLHLPDKTNEAACAEYHNRLMQMCQLSLKEVLKEISKKCEKKGVKRKVVEAAPSTARQRGSGARASASSASAPVPAAQLGEDE